MASKRKSMCIDEKVSLIRAIEKGDKKSDVAKRFGFSPSTVSTIWKNKEKFLQAEIEGKSSKKLKKPKFEDLDQAMLTWFRKQRQNNMPVSGPIMKAKAQKFAEQLSITDFKASEGWLGKFKQRHCIYYGKVKEKEARDGSTNVTYNWIKKVRPQFKEKYSSNDNFNADEARIIYKLTPDKTLKFKEGKLSKEQIKKNSEKKCNEEDETSDEPPPSIEQALHAAKLLKNFFLFNKDESTVSQDMNNIQRRLQLKYWHSKKRQTKIN